MILLAIFQRDVLAPAREKKLWQYIAAAVDSQQTQDQAVIEDNGIRLFCRKIQTVRAKELIPRGMNSLKIVCELNRAEV